MLEGIIEDIRVYPVEIPLARKFSTSMATQKTGNFVIVEVCSGELSGFGEVDPRPHITGETIDSAVAVLNKYLVPVVIGKSIFDLGSIHQAMQVVELNPSAKAAIDIGVFDLMGKIMNKPVRDLLGGLKNKPVILNAWAGIEDDLDKVLETILKKVERGFKRAAKVKAGLDYRRESQLLRRLVDALPGGMDIIVDANQAWSFRSAKRQLAEMAEMGVTIAEQPLRSDDLLGMQKLADSVPLALMADESVWTARDAFNLARMGAVSMFNLKLIKCGGLYQAMKFLGVAESAGISCMVGSTVQTSISAAAQAHLAAPVTLSIWRI